MKEADITLFTDVDIKDDGGIFGSQYRAAIEEETYRIIDEVQKLPLHRLHYPDAAIDPSFLEDIKNHATSHSRSIVTSGNHTQDNWSAIEVFHKDHMNTLTAS